MADDIETSFQLITGGGTPATFNAVRDLAGNLSAQSTPRVDGAPIGQTNPMPVAGVAIAPVCSLAPEAAHVAGTGACVLHAAQFWAPMSGWLLLYDLASVPADGAAQVPVKSWYFSSVDGEGWDRSFAPPLALRNGAVFVFSSTGPFAKTLNPTVARFSMEVTAS